MSSEDQSVSELGGAVVETSRPRGRGVRAATDLLVRSIIASVGTGDRAQLRRLRPDRPDAAAFWALLAQVVEAVDAAPREPAAVVEWERRWAVTVRCVAEMAELHTSSRPLGSALADAQVAPERVVRLLRSRAPGLFDEIRRVGQLVLRAGVRLDLGDLAELLRNDEGSRADDVRRKIARGYYAALRRKETT